MDGGFPFDLERDHGAVAADAAEVEENEDVFVALRSVSTVTTHREGGAG
jgi:hypothetical protein